MNTQNHTPAEMHQEMHEKIHHDGETHHHHHHDTENEYGHELEEEHVDINPENVMDINLSEDFYTLVWTALRKNVWHGREILGQKITLTENNRFWLRVDFLAFFVLLIVTFSLLIQQVAIDLKFYLAPWRITILRVTIMFWAQHRLIPEYKKGTTKFRFAWFHSKDFYEPRFALIISACQIFASFLSFFCILLFVCLSNEALPLIMHFAEMAILIELDDWVGEMIVKESPYEQHDCPSDVDSSISIDDNMHVLDKLALVKHDTFIYDNRDKPLGNCFLDSLACLVEYFPSSYLCLISIPFQYGLYYLFPGN